MKRTEIVMTALFCIALIATLLVFFLGLPLADKTDVDYTAFLFLLFSEAALYVAARFTAQSTGSGRRLFLTVSVLTTLAVYWAATVALALLVAPLYGGKLRHFFLLELLLLLAAAALTVVFAAFGARFSRNEAASAPGGELLTLVGSVRALFNDARFVRHFHALSLLCDELSLLDSRVCVPQTDDRLIGALRAIESLCDGGEDEAAHLIARAYDLARQRNAASKKNGTGF